MIIGIPIYEGVDLLDVMGPSEMFRWIDLPQGMGALGTLNVRASLTALCRIQHHRQPHTGFSELLGDVALRHADLQ
jgi:hypothetical protein